MYEHHWRNGDLVIWDNVALQHARPPIADGTRRTLRRVVCGTPYQHLIPPEVAAYYISG